MSRDKKKLVGVGLGAGLLGAVFLALKYAIRPEGRAPLPDTVSPAVFATKVLHTSLGQLIYHESGEGQPLIFLHSVGLGASSYEWLAVYPEFTGRYRVMAPDLIGFGESQRPDRASTASDYVRMLAELIRATAWGDKEPIIVASGLTGGFAVQFASQHPELVSRLILHMPTGGIQWGRARLRRGIRQAARWPLLQRFLYRNYQSSAIAVRTWLTQGGFVDPSRVTDEMVAILTTLAQQGGAEYAIRNFHAGRLNLDIEERLRSLSLPVTFLWGTEGGTPNLETGRHYQSITPNSQLIELPGLGALASLESPQQVAEALWSQLDNGLRVVD